VQNYNKLTQINREGITHLTGWLLQFRSYFCEHYEAEFDRRFKEFKELCDAKKILVPDRMCENYAMILTTYEVMTAAGVRFSFMIGDLKSFMLDTIKAQSEKRDVGSVTQRFWDIVLQLASEGIIKKEKEFRLDGNKLTIRWTEIHGHYLDKHSRLYRSPGLGKSTMLQKLRDSGVMYEFEGSNMKFEGKAHHSYSFYYDKLNIDLDGIIRYQEAEDAKRREDYRNRQQNLTNLTPPNQKAENGQNMTTIENSAKNDDLPF
jgi:hypothetical protein